MSGRGFLDERDGAKEALSTYEQFALGAGLRHRIGLLREVIEEDAAENFMFLENFVGIEPLRVSERPQLHRLADHRHVHADLRRRILEVARDPIDEQRHVIEQLVRGEDTIEIDGYALGNALEPAGRQFATRGPKAVRQCGGERAVLPNLVHHARGKCTEQAASTCARFGGGCPTRACGRHWMVEPIMLVTVHSYPAMKLVGPTWNRRSMRSLMVSAHASTAADHDARVVESVDTADSKSAGTRVLYE